MKNRKVIPATRPRNPLVAASRFRLAGRHMPAGHATRQQGRQLLRRELNHLPTDSP